MLPWIWLLQTSHRDFQTGLTYVTVSRVRTLESIMFDAAFDLSDIKGRNNPTREARVIDAERRESEVVRAIQ